VSMASCSLINTEICKEDLGISSRYAIEGT
jgi:hypothetical protein